MAHKNQKNGRKTHRERRSAIEIIGRAPPAGYARYTLIPPRARLAIKIIGGARQAGVEAVQTAGAPPGVVDPMSADPAASEGSRSKLSGERAKRGSKRRKPPERPPAW